MGRVFINSKDEIPRIRILNMISLGRFDRECRYDAEPSFSC